jgi:O-antigen/teichoic acid export membrane protein
LIQVYLKRIARDLSWVITLNFVNYSSSFIIAVLISRFLGTEGLGRYTFVTAVVALVYLISDFGLTTLLVRKITENKNQALTEIHNVNAAKVIVCISLLLLLAAGIFIRIKNFDSILLAGSLSAVPRLLQTSYEASIRAFLKQKYPTIIRSVNSFIQIIAAIVLLNQGKGLLAIFVMILITETLTVIAFRISAEKIAGTGIKSAQRKFSPTKIRALFKEASTFFAMNTLSFSMPRANIILLEYLNSTLAVGIFSAGVRFVNAIGLFTGALFNTYYPLISNIRGDQKLKYELTKKMAGYAFIAGAAISLSLYFLSEFLINITFKIPEAVSVLKITAFAVIPIMVYTVLQPFFYTVYKEKFLLKLFAIAFVFNSLSCIILIRLYGYIGCAVITVVTEYFVFIIILISFFSFKHKH